MSLAKTSGTTRVAIVRPKVPAEDLARAARAKAWREALGWSQKQLGRAIGLSVISVQDVERGYRFRSDSYTEIGKSVWKRYGMLIAGLEAKLAGHVRPIF